MPYKSKSQQAYFHAAEQRGEMPSSVVSEFDAASKGKFGKLPEHAAHGGELRCPNCGYAVGGKVQMAPQGDPDGFASALRRQRMVRR